VPIIEIQKFNPTIIVIIERFAYIVIVISQYTKDLFLRIDDTDSPSGVAQFSDDGSQPTGSEANDGAILFDVEEAEGSLWPAFFMLKALFGAQSDCAVLGSYFLSSSHSFALVSLHTRSLACLACPTSN
jgi:hypothetical protein